MLVERGADVRVQSNYSTGDTTGQLRLISDNAPRVTVLK